MVPSSEHFICCNSFMDQLIVHVIAFEDSKLCPTLYKPSWQQIAQGESSVHQGHKRKCDCFMVPSYLRRLLSARLLVRIPPMTRGIYCDPAHIQPVATHETPMTGATPNPPEDSSGLQREAPPRMSRMGYRTMFRSESFPSCQGCSLCIVKAPGLRLQTGPCMPYGLRLRVAT